MVPRGACLVGSALLGLGTGGSVAAATVQQVDGLPLPQVVLANLFEAELIQGGPAVTDRTNSNQYEAIGQVVESSALDGTQNNINALYLEVRAGTVIPNSGTHEIEIWIGEWDSSTDTPSTQLLRESFDVVGLNFVDGEIYEFEFSAPFSLDQTKDYAFEVWWTTDDASHAMSWERDTGQGFVDGGWISAKDKNLSLPFNAKPQNNTDLWFAFTTIPEPGSATMIMIAGAASLFRRGRACVR